MGVPETVLRAYAADGNNLSLAILIYVVGRKQFTYSWHSSWPKYGFSRVLRVVSRFDAWATSLELQHEFCALWNQIVREEQDCDDTMSTFVILRPLHDFYLVLHEDTSSAPPFATASTDGFDNALPSIYLLCKVSSRSHANHTSTSSHILRHNAARFPLSISHPDVPSSSVPLLQHHVPLLLQKCYL
jgi:hypothetical protein